MRIILATGGSGGHLFPAIKVAKELQVQGHEVLFVGSFRFGKNILKREGFVYEDIQAMGLVSSAWYQYPRNILIMVRAFFRSFGILKRFSPEAVLGFGGYGAFAVVMAAVFKGCPTMIHEQNVVPGEANAFLARFVKRIAISFKESEAYFNKNKTVLTGCPARLPKENGDKDAILKNFNLENDRKTILVFGGSQGSARINKIFLEAATSLKEKTDFQVIHITGKNDYVELQEQYNRIGIPVALFEFLDKMEEAYFVADLVVSRAGASTISEVASFKIPAIIIPYPYAKGHQAHNARVLTQGDAACLMEEKSLTADRLADEIQKRFVQAYDKQRIYKGVCMVEAAKRLAYEVIQL